MTMAEPLKPDEIDEPTKIPGAQAEKATPAESARGAEGEPGQVRLEPLQGTPGSVGKEAGLDLLGDVNVNVRVELGRTRVQVQDVLKLAPGSVVPLNSLTGDPLDVYVNDRLVARGEVLVVNDNFAVRVTEVLPPPLEQA